MPSDGPLVARPSREDDSQPAPALATSLQVSGRLEPSAVPVATRGSKGSGQPVTTRSDRPVVAPWGTAIIAITVRGRGGAVTATPLTVSKEGLVSTLASSSGLQGKACSLEHGAYHVQRSLYPP